jgi:hypothetical protein
MTIDGDAGAEMYEAWRHASWKGVVRFLTEYQRLAVWISSKSFIGGHRSRQSIVTIHILFIHLTKMTDSYFDPREVCAYSRVYLLHSAVKTVRLIFKIVSQPTTHRAVVSSVPNSPPGR